MTKITQQKQNTQYIKHDKNNKKQNAIPKLQQKQKHNSKKKTKKT